MAIGFQERATKGLYLRIIYRCFKREEYKNLYCFSQGKIQLVFFGPTKHINTETAKISSAFFITMSSHIFSICKMYFSQAPIILEAFFFYFYRYFSSNCKPTPFFRCILFLFHFSTKQPNIKTFFFCMILIYKSFELLIIHLTSPYQGKLRKNIKGTAKENSFQFRTVNIIGSYEMKPILYGQKIQQEPKETSIRGTMKTYVVPLVKFAVQKPEHVNSGDQSPFYNIIEMEVTTQIKPCYYVFHTVPAQNFQNPYQNFLSPQPTLIWTYQLNPTTSHLEPVWPQKAQTPTAAFQPTQNSLILPQPAIKEASKRNQRRTKNKRLRNSKKELESAKKNSQSNIVNQLFSFFNSYEKSQSVVEKAIVRMRNNIDDVDRIKAIFYNIVRLINYRRGRNYVNKQNILNYYTPQGFTKNIPDIEFKLGQIQLLTLEELCLLFRVTTSYFIRNISMSAILTSKRISMIAKNEHLKRRRRVYASLCEKNP